jgi:lycopene beta-cyclase
VTEGGPGGAAVEQTTVDVVVVGDGPAGAGAAGACAAVGLETVLVGPGAAWTATYGVWRDDVPWLGDDVFAATRSRVVVHGARSHEIDRPYGIVDGAALAAALTAGVTRLSGLAGRAVRRSDGTWRVPIGSGSVTARRAVVLATGSPSPTPRTAWQTAWGVVLDELPDEVGPRDAVTLMDFREPARTAPDVGAPTFCYLVPLAEGRWLVEETVLAARPAVPPELLRARLLARLGPDGEALVAGAHATETVRIPMGGGIPAKSGRAMGSAGSASSVVPFGAAAGLVHPATGYSVAASLRLAPVLAEAIAAGRDPVAAVWTPSTRRARALHEFGLDVVTGLDADATRAFFDAFFDQPVDRWRDYLRVDTTARAVSGVMWQLFRSAPWSLRRRLMSGDPRRLRVPRLDGA